MTHFEPWGRSPRPDHLSTLDPAAPPVVRGTDQILAIVPLWLGYRPDHSLVILATIPESSTRTGFRGSLLGTLRIDLPREEDLPLVGPSLGEHLARAAQEEQAEPVLHAFCYDVPVDEAGEPEPAYLEALGAMLQEVASTCGGTLHDLHLVRDRGREHRALIHAGEPEADAPWQPVLATADVPLAADLVLEGRGVLPSRDEVVAAVRRRDEAAAAAADLAVDMLLLDPARLDEDETLAALGSWVVDGEPVPGARERAWIGVLLSDRHYRDAVLARWLPSVFTMSDALTPAEAAAVCQVLPAWPETGSGAAVDRLLHLAGRIPRELNPPLLVIAAFAAWVHGHGTVANEACDLALEIDPDYTMGQLLHQLLGSGIRPPRAQGRPAHHRRVA